MLKRIKMNILKLYYELKDHWYYGEIIDNELYIVEFHIYYDDRLVYTTKKDIK